MKSTLYAILVFGALLMSCTSKKALSSPEAIFSAIIVNDMDRSLAWYQNVLNCEIVDEFNAPERGLRMVNLKTPSLRLELIETSNSLDPKDILADKNKKTRIRGLFKFGLQVKDFDGWVEFLEKAEVTFNGNVVTDKLTNKKMVIINDPDGNRIQFFEK